MTTARFIDGNDERWTANSQRCRWPVDLLSFLLVGFTVAATAELVYVFGDNNTLISFDDATPGIIAETRTITGLGSGEIIRGIDFRPAGAQLYALGSTNRLYRIDTASGVATAIGSGPFQPALSGQNVGFDFNPTVDRIRVVTDVGENVRLHPDTGGFVASDTLLAYAAGDINASATPNVVAVAYTNSIAFSTSTTLYGIDAGTNTLVRHGSLNSSPVSPNAGTLFTIGPLGVDVANDTNLDVSSAPAGTAYMTARSSTGTDFYRIDLSTGAATRVNTIAGTTQVFGMAVGQASLVFTIPVMGSAMGQNNTSFRGDLIITNSSAFSVAVTIDFFEAGVGAKTGPTASVQLTLAAGQQQTRADIVKTLFNRDPGTGAIRVTASRPISVVGRIYNDTPNGTFGQFIRGAEDAERRSSGVLPALRNTPSIPKPGFRTNIGWFNPNTTDLNVMMIDEC